MSPHHRKRSNNIPKRRRRDPLEEHWGREEGVEERVGEKMTGQDTEFGRFHAEKRGVCRVSEESVVDGILVEGCSYLKL